MGELFEKEKSIVLNIHDNIFKNISEKFVDVFLCGGASSKKHISLRDKIRKKLAENTNIRVLYPEDLFIDLLNKKKNYDLLTLEKFLADNCDIICITCESAGSLVELGAFTNNSITFNKVVAIMDHKHKKDKSFIMLGPIKQIKKNDKNNVIFYDENIDKLCKELNSLFNRKRHMYLSKRNRDINTIINQYYFILILLYFYNSIDINKLVRFLQLIKNEKNLIIDDFDVLYTATLKLLYKDRYIEKSIVGEKEYYSLTSKGYSKVVLLLESLKIKSKAKVCDSIRLSILKNEFY